MQLPLSPAISAVIDFPIQLGGSFFRPTSHSLVDLWPEGGRAISSGPSLPSSDSAESDTPSAAIMTWPL